MYSSWMTMYMDMNVPYFINQDGNMTLTIAVRCMNAASIIL